MSGRYSRVICAAVVVVAALWLPAVASADYEQVGHFGVGGEAEQLQNAFGMAVNVSGAGGVEPGSIYVVGRNARVVRYGPGHEGEEPPLREAWGWGVGDGAGEFQRCGPALATEPAQHTYGICRPAVSNATRGGEEIGHFEQPLPGVAVDQATGNVYVLNNSRGVNREHNLIEVFSADGSHLITRFGDAGRNSPAPSESIAEGPEKLHTFDNAIIVDEDGKVYVTDTDFNDIANPPGEARVMSFEPQSPGDYEHYVYSGRSEDIKLGPESALFGNLALDDAGNLYGANGSKIEERSLSEPGAPPICTFKTSSLGAMTVNPHNGEVFYSTTSAADKSLHHLRPCNTATGKFEEAQAPVKPSPIGSVQALAINPTLTWGPNRPAGVLYGVNSKEGIGYVFAPAEVHPPSVESESSFATRTTSSILRAEIDPHGFATHFVFEYLTEAEYEANEPAERFAGAKEAPVGGGGIGGGGVGQATAAISGLEPDTTYRFRVIASSECDEETSEPCVAEGEAASFATYPATPPGLPDHRAYELVSPAQKNGGEVIPAEPEVASCHACKPITGGNIFPMQSSPSGDAVAYEGEPFSPAEGPVNFASYLSRRTSSGWQTIGLSPTLQSLGSAHVAFDAALGQGLLAQTGFNHVALGPEAPAEYPNLYAQDTADPGALTPLVTQAPPNRTSGGFNIAYGGRSSDFSHLFFSANDALTKETPFAPIAPDPGETKNNLYEWHEGRLALVNVAPGNSSAIAGAKFASSNPDTHAVSEDGSRVYFTGEAGQLYVREAGEGTIEIPDPGHFLTASPDGSEVLLSNGHRYGLETAEVTDLSEGMGGFQGIVGQSTDLSHLYFVDTAALTGGEENEANEVAEAGRNNLYSWSEGAITFVVQLTSGITTKDLTGVTVTFVDNEDWAANPSARTAEASPDGRYLAFISHAPLTGYDNVGPTCHRDGVAAFYTSPCDEAFLYDSQTRRLACASCNPTGETPLGSSYLRQLKDPGPIESLPQPRYLTDEGRLYFDSADSLVARDTNEGVEDVYEYEMPGAGAQSTCEREAGCTFLISAGSEPVDSNLLAVDETGKNVFFDTRDKLALKDKDELLDLYDAREGGGIAAEGEVGRAECQGEACQTPASAPNDPTPGSSTFEGAGNVKEPVAAKKHAKKHKKRHAKKHKRATKRNRGGAK